MSTARTSPHEGPGEHAALPKSLRANPRLSQWLRFDGAGFVEVCSGKVEIGQGILTALAQIVADELDVPLAHVRMMPASTDRSPDEAVTSGSLSIQESGEALRYACAEARSIFLQAAATRLEVPADALAVQQGVIASSAGEATSYWELASDVVLDRDATARIAPKPAGRHRVVGADVARRDLEAKVLGDACFIHDLELPHMLHGRILRPPRPGARLLELADAALAGVAGIVSVVRDGSFVGVLSQTEAAAERAAVALDKATRWTNGTPLPDEAALSAWLQRQEAEISVVDARSSGRRATVAHTVSATYSRPYLAHASIGPSCALAQVDGRRLRVWTHSQGIYNLRRDLAMALRRAEDTIVVQHMQGAGCYGHNGADDVAFDAARLALAAGGRPVRVQWSRADEMTWAPLGPAMVVSLAADLDATGAILHWLHEIWSNGHTSRPGRAKSPTLLGGYDLAEPFERLSGINPSIAGGGGADRNAVPLYDLPAWQIVNHRILAMPLRASALRSLGAFANVFAIESFLDEIAAMQRADPVAFRLRHLRDPRARAVVERTAARAAWGEWRKRDGYGHGVGFARYKNTGAYCAVIAEVEADADIRVRRLFIAVDVGLVINPDGVANQIEGGAVQSTSWTLKEAVRFDRTRVTSDGWDAYPTLRCSETPLVEVEIVSRPDEPSVGAGEAAQGPTAAAIGNAVFDALGVRVRDLPLTRERVAAAIDAAR